MKYCKQCEKWKPYKEYGKSSARIDGLTIYCKICTRDNYTAYFEKNKKHIQELQKKYARKKQEERKEAQRLFLEKNPNYLKQREAERLENRRKSHNMSRRRNRAKKSCLKRLTDCCKRKWHIRWNGTSIHCDFCKKNVTIEIIFHYLSVTHRERFYYMTKRRRISERKNIKIEIAYLRTKIAKLKKNAI